MLSALELEGVRIVRLLSIALFAAASGCSVGDASLAIEGKACPCIDGWHCEAQTNRCVPGDAVDASNVAEASADAAATDAATDTRPPPGGDCSVHADGRLYCANSPDDMHSEPNPTSPVVNRLETTYSWFDCWATGTLHAGGNTTWYHTFGDKTAAGGYVPGVDLKTTDAFDANPSAFGLVRCGM